MKKKKQINWIAFYGIVGAIDAFQIGLDFITVPISPAGEIINDFLDVVIAIGICLFCWYKGVLDFMTFCVVLGTFFIEQFTGGGAPFWVLDVYAIQKRAKASGNLAPSAQEEEKSQNNALNYGRMRQPTRKLPLNSEKDIRRPSDNS